MKVYEKKLKDLRAKEEADRLEQQKQKLEEEERKKCEEQEVKEAKEDEENPVEQSTDKEREGLDAQMKKVGYENHICDAMKVDSKASSQNVHYEDEIMSNDAALYTSSSLSRKRSRGDDANTEGISKKEEIPVLSRKKSKIDANAAPDTNATTLGPSLISSTVANQQRHFNDQGKDHLLDVNHPSRSASNSLSSILLNGGTTSDLLMRLSNDTPISLGEERMNRDQEIVQLLQQLQQNLVRDQTAAGGVDSPSIPSLLAPQETPDSSSSTLSGGNGSRGGQSREDIRMYMDLLRQQQRTNGMVQRDHHHHKNGDDVRE